MNSATPVIDRSDQHDAEQTSTDAVQRIAAPFAEAAINDGDFYRSPLWMVERSSARMASS
ncbi:MAG TPA: hypothetical protein VIR54_27285 [Vicinamibacterales bacterium]